MFESDRPYTFDRVVRMVLALAAGAGIIWLLGHLADALVPFVAALLLAYLLNPVVTALERRVRSRSAAVFLTVAGLAALLVGLAWLVVPRVAAEFSAMGAVLRQLADDSGLAARVRAFLPPDLWQWLRDFATRPDVQALFSGEGAMNLLKSGSEHLLPGIGSVLQGTLGVLGGLVSAGVVLLYLVFLLADFGRIREGWRGYLPEPWRDRAVAFATEFEATMRRYFRSQVVIALLVGALLSIGFLLIGLPLAVVLGMLIGVLNIAPYLGTLGIIPAVLAGMLSALETGGSPLVGAGLVLLVCGAVQAVQDLFLVPRIQGESLGLTPWMILLSLSVWGKLLGFLGLLVALPMTCLCLSWYRRWLAEGQARRQDAVRP
ncbi:AI-2E family transporter [Pseudodesulfovibrio sp.]|uniref:AI-2E family transporter n=1 Tax=Pseudodesulfovibrio sp. TaxID=2035812 RepID=UPI00262A858F|nr:AI-2E family transporter [Pseudodesulfovibrio sp.]MDD3311675.1 AI-2E family transporter [Pseudodesulfovibrio sp.]